MNEQALLLGRSQPVVGIMTEPGAPDPQRPAFILSNSGIVHRVGPSRVYVRIARRLAELGFVVVRIDHRGIGDSDPRRDTMPFFSGAIEEIREVMDELESGRGFSRFVIMGICSGADIAFSVAGIDDRVAGLALINGGGLIGHPDWMRYMQGRGYARRYLRESIYRPDRWLRALTGRIQYRALVSVLARRALGIFGQSTDIAQHARSFEEQFQSLVDQETQVLLVHSSDDASVDHRDVILGDRLDALMATGRFHDATIADADHTFTLLEKQEELLAIIATWAVESWSEGSAAARAAADGDPAATFTVPR